MASSPPFTITMLSCSSHNRFAPCQRCKASQHFAASLPAISLSHLAFLLDSWSSVQSQLFLPSSHRSNKKFRSNEAAPLRSIYLSLFGTPPLPKSSPLRHRQGYPESCSLWSRHIASDSTASLCAYPLRCVLRQCRDRLFRHFRSSRPRKVRMALP